MIHDKIVEIMNDLGHIPKTDTNQFQNYKYRGIEATLKALHPLLVKHRVTMLPAVVDVLTEVRQSSKGKPVNWCFLTVKYTFTDADDGSSTACVVVGESADSQDKSSGQAMSQAEKQAVFQTFVVPTGEPDPDSRAPFHDESPSEAFGGPPPRGGASYASERAESQPEGDPNAVSKAQLGMIGGKLSDIGIEPKARGQRLHFVNQALDLNVKSSKELTKRQASTLIDIIEAIDKGTRVLLFSDDGLPYAGTP